MSKMTVEIDLAELGQVPVDAETGEPIGPPLDLRALVADSVGHRLFQHVWNEMRNELRGLVHEVVNEEVRDQVRKHVTEALAKPIQKTTRWGENQGEPTTLLELTRVELEKFLNGTEVRRDGFSREKPANLAELVRATVAEYSRKELAQDIAAARSEVTRKFKEAVGKYVADGVAESR